MSDPKIFPEGYSEFLFKRHEDRLVDAELTHEQAVIALAVDATEPVLRYPDHRDPLYVEPPTVRECLYAALFEYQLTMKEAIRRLLEERVAQKKKESDWRKSAGLAQKATVVDAPDRKSEEASSILALGTNLDLLA
jgi:hypothetical protein